MSFLSLEFWICFGFRNSNLFSRLGSRLCRISLFGFRIFYLCVLCARSLFFVSPMFRAQTFRKTHRRGAEHTEMRIIYVLLINLFSGLGVLGVSYENSDQRKNPPVLRPAPFAKGAIGGFLRRWSRPLRLIFMRGVVPIGT